MTTHVRLWLAGLISAFLSGVSGVLAINFIDPHDFNMENPKKLVLAAVAFGIVGVVNYLKDKPLPPDGGDTVTMPRGNMGALLLACVLAMPACGALRAPVAGQPTAEQVQATRAQSVALADAVQAAGDVVDKGQAATASAYRAGLITLEARNKVYGFVLELEKAVLEFTTAAEAATSDPSLRATVRAFLPYVDKLVQALASGAGEAMVATAGALRAALRLLYDYNNGGDL